MINDILPANGPNPSDREKEAGNQLVFSYLTLRNLVGFCGILLPIALSAFPACPGKYYGFEPSISDYFYTNRGDVLVVILSVLAVFLFTYTGYNWKERVLTSTAAICGLGVAFVPTHSKDVDWHFSTHTTNGGIFFNFFSEGVHIGLAAVFLLSLAVMSLVYFPKTDAPSARKPDGSLTQKAKRNIVYKICGWIMVGSVIVLAIYFAFKPNLENFPVIFVFETIAVEAFGLSWITKGETLWPDGRHYIAKAFNPAQNPAPQ